MSREEKMEKREYELFIKYGGCNIVYIMERK